MKKLITFALVCLLVLTGCNNEKQVSTYSFHGEHEAFTISNGSIILSEEEEVFHGGELKTTQSGLFDEMDSYSTAFYTLIHGEQEILHSNTVIDQTDGSITINWEEDDLGSISSEAPFISSKFESMNELKENLWFELKITYLNGEEKVYQIPLTFTE